MSEPAVFGPSGRRTMNGKLSEVGTAPIGSAQSVVWNEWRSIRELVVLTVPSQICLGDPWARAVRATG